jgi:putative ABC transport system substrate-binding protein
MSYAINYADLWRRAARYVDKILQEPTSFELTVNLKTARAIGLELPTTHLAPG